MAGIAEQLRQAVLQAAIQGIRITRLLPERSPAIISALLSIVL